MLEATSQITFQRPCRENDVVSIQWHNAFECEIMSIWGVCLCAYLFCFHLKACGTKKRDKHVSFIMGSCRAPIIDPHLKPRENYSIS